MDSLYVVILQLNQLSHFNFVQLFATPWIVTCQALLSMGFSRREYWTALPCLPPGDLPNPWIEHESLISPALAGRFFTTCATWEEPIWGMVFSKVKNL